jgi:hypothetical protein
LVDVRQKIEGEKKEKGKYQLVVCTYQHEQTFGRAGGKKCNFSYTHSRSFFQRSKREMEIPLAPFPRNLVFVLGFCRE